MSIKPIKIEQDYRQAMTEVDKLWGAKDGTPKGGRLDVLLVLLTNMKTNITRLMHQTQWMLFSFAWNSWDCNDLILSHT